MLPAAKAISTLLNIFFIIDFNFTILIPSILL